MNRYRFQGWIPLNFTHEFIILNSDSNMKNYNKKIINKNELHICLSENNLYNKTYTSENGFTMLNIMHLVYKTAKLIDEEQYDGTNHWEDSVFDGFDFDENTSSIYMLTSS